MRGPKRASRNSFIVALLFCHDLNTVSECLNFSSYRSTKQNLTYDSLQNRKLLKKANLKIFFSCFQFFFFVSFWRKKRSIHICYCSRQSVCAAALLLRRGKPPFFGHIKSNPAFGCTSRRASTAFFSVSNAHKRKVLGAHVDLFSSPSWSRDFLVCFSVQVSLVSSPSELKKNFSFLSFV